MRSLLLPYINARHITDYFPRHFPSLRLFSAPVTPLTANQLTSRTAPCTFTDILDVRSPAEFQHDRLPTAINLPVLNQEQHVEIGTLYKGQRFEARRVGAAHVSRNIATLLDTFFADKDPATFKPLIYCWRGGQRSQSLTHILSEIGIQVHFLQGGYKAYRKNVSLQLSAIPSQCTFMLLSGHTGSGKTKVLDRMKQNGHQVIDLEALAEHRGSLLGHTDGVAKVVQPSQKLFESRILEELLQVDVTKIIWLEAESNKIGNVHIPTELWSAMKHAKRVHLRVPVAERVRYTLQTYQYWVEERNREELTGETVLGRLKKQRGQVWCEEMVGLVQAEKWQELVHRLLHEHYDVLYQENANRYAEYQVGEVYLEELKDEKEMDRVVLPQIDAVVRGVVVEGERHGSSAG